MTNANYSIKSLKTVQHICGAFGGDINLAIWQFWLQLPDLMYTNTDNHVHYEAS